MKQTEGRKSRDTVPLSFCSDADLNPFGSGPFVSENLDLEDPSLDIDHGSGFGSRRND
jgi:hypothetical protein